MAPSDDVLVRDATADDVAAICQFGEVHIRPHYSPLIGAQAADAQVRDWWSQAKIGAAVTKGLVVVGVRTGRVVGVGQRGLSGVDHVIYKLYVDPEVRGQGLGPRLIDALVAQLPTGAERLFLEHFSANARASAFYEREGFVVDRVDESGTLPVVWRVCDLTADGSTGRRARSRGAPPSSARPGRVHRGTPHRSWPTGSQP